MPRRATAEAYPTPLERRIQEGSFREDLFHRIAVLVVDVPALRERRTDIPAIAEALLSRSRRELGEKECGPVPLEQGPGRSHRALGRVAAQFPDLAVSASSTVRTDPDRKERR